jgi:phenylacetate 2-hydroxylase
MPIVDLETNLIVKDLFEDSKSAKRQEINPRGYICRFALNTSLTLNYGLRIGGTIDDELLNEVVIVEREIGNLRSTSHNWQDYVPLLRILPNSDNKAKEMRDRRDKYLTYLLGELRKRIADGTDKPCITGNILKDPEAKLTEGMLLKVNSS